MKTIVRVILSGFFVTVCLQALHSQNTVSYGYDAAGNRISRVIEMPKLKSASAPVEEEPQVVYSEMLADIRINIYPNPTHGKIKIDIQNLPKGETANINLYSLSGHLVVSKHKVTSSVEIDITGKHNGIYLLKIIAGKQQTEWKIIKK